VSGLAWKRFTEGDWMGFAGAEPFADGTDPLLAELHVDGQPALAIFDATGIRVVVFEGECEQLVLFTLPADRAAQVIALLPESTTMSTLVGFGFEDVS
jgi:hypothetical protein